ncbi:MAG: methyltransferase [Prevotella sp.]|nr:methyltransferase [Prevotella sp.]
MANDYFQFKQFIVRQQHCGMKVGTDGTLLGAWAQAPDDPCRILDIGTGTGLIALMMAQRFPQATVTGVDIDDAAVSQAKENVMESPFSNRVTILKCDILQLEDTDGFDAIICNPPFFVNSLTCPDEQRTAARHTVSLSFENLAHAAFRLLKPDGIFSVVIPTENRPNLEAASRMEGFFISRICLIKTTPQKQPKRQLIEFRKFPVYEINIQEGIIEDSPNVKNPWYRQLTEAFYIK